MHHYTKNIGDSIEELKASCIKTAVFDLALI